MTDPQQSLNTATPALGGLQPYPENPHLGLSVALFCGVHSRQPGVRSHFGDYWMRPLIRSGEAAMAMPAAKETAVLS